MNDPTGDLGMGEYPRLLAAWMLFGLPLVVVGFVLALWLCRRGTHLSFWQWLVGLGAIVALSVRGLFRHRP